MITRKLTSRFGTPMAAAALLLISGGCSQQDNTDRNQAAIDNAMDEYAAITADADERAEHLDDRASELLAEANVTNSAYSRAATAEAKTDLEDAAAIRDGGESLGAKAEENVEQSAGLLD